MICEMSPTQLAARCQNIQPDASHEPFCFELFRRAIIEGCSLCWQYLHNQYYSLVHYWISRCTSPDPDAIDDLTQDAFTTFWRFYTPDKLNRASGLGAILSYLKSCTMSAVAQVRREVQKLALEVEWDEQVENAHPSTHSAEVDALQEISAQQLWVIVEMCCNDERDYLLARLIFVAGLKPSQISGQFPDQFPQVSDVYRLKRNLLDRLRRNQTLHDIRKNWPNERLIG